MGRAYYNEIEPFAAQWLRSLIAAGHIAPGDVDERSIVDVRPDDLAGYTQCHFFAGIGVWSYALRLAGWPDDRPVWTGSCPCQPFSAAGAGGGFDDERHLWPAFHHLIRVRRPPVFLGEQVASKDGLAWLDLVQADLEATGYACGAVDLCAAGVGAPHIRQRQWIFAERLADASGSGLEGQDAGALGDECASTERGGGDDRLEEARRHCRKMRDAWPAHAHLWGEDRAISLAGALRRGLAHSAVPRRSEQPLGDGREDGWASAKPGRLHPSRWLAEPDRAGLLSRQRDDQAARYGHSAPTASVHDRHGPPGPVNGLWRDADWLFCRDGKWRPVEPGTFPLAHGAAARVGRLRGYGNAINAEAAAEVIGAYLDIRRGR
ncbi:DNA cytosine methyltransferase [Aquabacter sp. CN5-332]|uniref:DNA cytosine methyltransferase n=1 Tax=Aquabacter sp. CN5-332 TaxID=3156608 RepID=UPI0032B4A09A